MFGRLLLVAIFSFDLVVPQVHAQGAPRSEHPTPVWSWAKHPDRADIARVYPLTAGPDLTSFGSITCILDATRRPTRCQTSLDGSPEIGFSKVVLSLAPLWQGPEDEGANLPVGAPILMTLYFQPAEQIISDPFFIGLNGAKAAALSAWAVRPSLKAIASIIPDDAVGASSATIECTVAPNRTLNACSFSAPKIQCYNTDGSKECRPDQIRALTPEDVRLLRLSNLLIAPEIAPDGGSSVGRRLRFFVNVQQLSMPPLPLRAPPLSYQQAVRQISSKTARKAWKPSP